MKRIFIGALMLLLAAWVTILCLGVGMPAAGNLEPTCARDRDGVLWLAENQRWTSRLYGGNENGTISQIYREDRRVNGQVTAITQVASGTHGLYFIRQTYAAGSLTPEDWALCRLDAVSGALQELMGGVQLCDMEVTGLAVADGQVLVAGVAADGSAALCALPDARDADPSAWAVQMRAGSGVLSAAADGDGLILQLADGQSVRATAGGTGAAADYPKAELPASLSATFKVRVLCKLELLVMAAICAAAILALALLLRWAGRVKTLAAKGAAVTAVCLLAVLALTSVLLTAGGARFQRGVLEEESVETSQAKVRLLEASDPAAVLQSNFSGSEAAEVLGLVLDGGDELFALHSGGTAVALSGRAPCGVLAEQVLNAEELTLVEQAARGISGVRPALLRGRDVTICAQPVYANGVAVAVLLTRTAAELEGPMAGLGLTLLVLGLLFLAFLVALYLFLRRTTRPVQELTKQMRAVSDGDLTPREVTDRRDELGEMSRAMQEMCMGLSIRDYEVDAVLSSYSRFIPRELDKLLGRASVMEVSFGDAATLTGAVSVFTISNRELARASLADDAFVDFVSESFSLLREKIVAHHGRLLSTGFDLASVPVYYPNSVSDAVQAGLDLLGELRGRGDTDSLTPDFCVLLHHTAFLYGIAGTQEQVFPFISSSEMEFLGGYNQRFRSAGVRMVLTEALVQRLDVGCNTRYLGFVTTPDGKRTYKLYEALDTYPDIERNLRIRYDRRFQEGIRLFYHNDFYLARNIFSALLKACPQDGIVRWYLFACERFFNSGQEELNYQLFGVDQ